MAVIVVTALLFVCWLVVIVLRGITRLFLGPGLKTPPKLAQRDPPHTRRCERESCRAINASEARFCRRCGQRMGAPQRASVQRAAVA
jgi:uncharacterized paraquat-inducible protein A